MASKKCTMCSTTRSSTNIYDVEARPSSPAPSAAVPTSHGPAATRWTCSQCTLVNDGSHSHCSACRNARGHAPTAIEQIACINDRNRAVSPPGGSSSSSSFSAAPRKWTCQHCTYDNFMRSSKCTLCDGASPQTALSTPAATPATTPGVERPTARFDDLFMNASREILLGDDLQHVAASVDYVNAGGDLTRRIGVDESRHLLAPDAAHCTLPQLASRRHRTNTLECLRRRPDRPKRVPSHCSQRNAEQLLASAANAVKRKKTGFPNYFVTECPTFFLPRGLRPLT